MGLGTTMKNMLSSDGPSHQDTEDRRLGTPRSNVNEILDPEAEPLDPSNRASNKLPPGAGPGTSGKVPSEGIMERDLDQSRTNQDIAGYGTDAAAAAGGTLAGTHRVASGDRRASTGDRSGGPSNSILGSGFKASGAPVTNTRRSSVPGRDTLDQNLNGPSAPLRSASELDTNSPSSGPRQTATQKEPKHDLAQDFDTGVGHTGPLTEGHSFGHTKTGSRESMPSGDAQEDTNQLFPVTHEHVRHLETEEVARVKEHERHIHHIQHHTQPIITSEELPEQHREFIHPITHIQETHGNKPEDNTLFQGQIRQHHDILKHGPKERKIIDKGTTVTEKTHHHVHHIIQPIIHKETIEKHRIHTTIPIHEVTHEAPVVHQSQTHEPVPIEHFLQRGGTLAGDVSHEEIAGRVLNAGQCSREVKGVAESLERELNLTREFRQGTRATHTHTAGMKDADLAAKKAAQRNTTTNIEEQPLTAPSRN